MKITNFYKLLCLSLIVGISLLIIAGCSMINTSQPTIQTFSFEEQVGSSVISLENKTIYAELAKGTDLSNLSPSIGIPEGYTIEPGSGEARDFTDTVTYILEYQDTGETWEWDVTVSISDNYMGNVIQNLDYHSDKVRSIALSTDENLLASGSDDETIKIYDLDQGQVVKTISPNHGKVFTVDFSPDGSLLAVGFIDSQVKVYDVNDDYSEYAGYNEHTDQVKKVRISPDGNIVASASKDNSIKLYNLNDDTIETYQHSGKVISLAFSPTDNILASGDTAGEIKILDLNQSAFIKTMSPENGNITSLEYSADGEKLAVGFHAGGNKVAVYDVNDDYNEIVNHTDHNDNVEEVTFSLDGNRVFSGSRDSNIIIFDLNAETAQTLEGHGNTVNEIIVSPDDGTLMSCSQDETIKIWQ